MQLGNSIEYKVLYSTVKIIMHSHNIGIAIESTIYVLIHLWKNHTTIFHSTTRAKHSTFFFEYFMFAFEHTQC